MYHFIIFFLVYCFSIIFHVYFDVKYLFLAAVFYAVIYYVINKKILINIILILLISLAIITVNYNSKSDLIQHINHNAKVIVHIKNLRTNNDGSYYRGYDAVIKEIDNVITNEKTIVYIKKTEEINENSLISFNGEVAGLSEYKNRLLFSYKEYLRNNNIFATVFCKSEYVLLSNDYSFLDKIFNKSKDFIEKLFKNHMNDENANLILSIILGDKKYLDDEFYVNIQKTGLAHLFAVSGLHIAIIYGALIKFFKLLGFGRKIGWTITWGILWLYGFLIGFPISVFRSLLMFNFLFASRLMYRRYNSINSIIISALIMLIYNPFFLFEVGFQLSYTAALSLVFFNRFVKTKVYINIRLSNRRINDFINTIFNAFTMYITIQFFTFPILSYYFNYISTSGMILNLLVVPIFSIILVVSFVLIPIGLLSIYTAVLPLLILDYVLTIVTNLIEFSNKVNFTGIEIGSISLNQIFYWYVLILLVIFLREYRKNSIYLYKYIMLCYSIFFTVNFISLPIAFSGMRLDIIDVGQGSFANLRYKGINMIFDVGSLEDNIGKYVAVPFFTKRGFNEIDAIFISHLHEDHYNGLFELYSNKKVHNVFLNEIDIDNILNKKFTDSIDYSILKSGNIINLSDNFSVEVLWPDKNYSSSNLNNMSNVYQITVENIKILICGDIEKEAEERLLNKLEEVDILLVPHHGSGSSSTEEFVERLKPKLAVMSYGENDFGIPSMDVVERYNRVNSNVLSTFIHGEINILEINGNLYYNTYVGQVSDNMYKLYLTEFLINLFAFILNVFIINVLKNNQTIF